MKPRSIILGLRVLGIVIMMGSCARDELENSGVQSTPVNGFFVLPEAVAPQLKIIADSLRTIDQVRPFVNAISLHYGTPRWDKSINGTRGSTFVTIVPLQRLGDNSVSGFMALEMGSRLDWKVYDARKPEKYGFVRNGKQADARAVNDLVRALNFSVFGRNGGSISDPCLMASEDAAKLRNARRIEPDKNVQLYASVIEITTCYTWETCMGDGYGNCTGTKTLHSDCITEYIWVNGSDGGYPADENVTGDDPVDEYIGPSRGNSRPVSSPNVCGDDNMDQQVYVEGPEKPINDINVYVGCFSGDLPAKITFYADQPSPGSGEAFSIKEKSGHAFISIEQNVNGKLVRRSIGFYPKHQIDPFYGTSGESQLGDNSKDSYDVRLEVEIKPEQTQNVLRFIRDPPNNYNLQKYNCTHFVLDISDIIGLNIPRTVGDWIIGKGLNPGSFGEDLKKKGAIAGKGIAPTNLASCN